MSPYATGYAQRFFGHKHRNPHEEGTEKFLRFEDGRGDAAVQLKAFDYGTVEPANMTNEKN